MHVLFLHDNFPAQYRHVAAALGREGGHRVVFATHRKEGGIPGVRRIAFAPAREPGPTTHHYLRGLEGAVLNGQAVFRLCRGLQAEGFEPDVICAHSGWGPALYVKDAFPKARLLGYFEWFYRAAGSDADFLDPAGMSDDDRCRIRTRNGPILLDLAACDRAISPTAFQRSQFPEGFRERIEVMHDGIDTAFFTPSPTPALHLPGIELPAGAPILTYATRGMEPYRGFPQFMRAAALLQSRRPDLHVVVVGEDRVAYGRKLPEGESWKRRMLDELPELDRDRLHFTGLLPYAQYREVLRASWAHVYLTVPFVLSWGAMEAMSAGCAIVGSDTPPVREVMQDGRSALLVDFFSVEAIVEAADRLIADRALAGRLGAAARQTIVDAYALSDLLPRHLALIRETAGQR